MRLPFPALIVVATTLAACGQGVAPARSMSARQALMAGPELLEFESVSARQELYRELVTWTEQVANDRNQVKFAETGQKRTCAREQGLDLLNGFRGEELLSIGKKPYDALDRVGLKKGLQSIQNAGKIDVAELVDEGLSTGEDGLEGGHSLGRQQLLGIRKKPHNALDRLRLEKGL